jgi:hypothetical protein
LGFVIGISNLCRERPAFFCMLTVLSNLFQMPLPRPPRLPLREGG